MAIKRLSSDGRQTDKAIITLIALKYKTKPNTNIHNANEKKAYRIYSDGKPKTSNHLSPQATDH